MEVHLKANRKRHKTVKSSYYCKFLALVISVVVGVSLSKCYVCINVKVLTAPGGRSECVLHSCILPAKSTDAWKEETGWVITLISRVSSEHQSFPSWRGRCIFYFRTHICADTSILSAQLFSASALRVGWGGLGNSPLALTNKLQSKYLGVYSSKLDCCNTDALHYLLMILRSFNICCTILQMFHHFVVSASSSKL